MATTQNLRNRDGTLRGTLTYEAHRVVLRDARGVLLGTFQDGVTRNARGVMVGYGDVLTSLLG